MKKIQVKMVKASAVKIGDVIVTDDLLKVAFIESKNNQISFWNANKTERMTLHENYPVDIKK